MSVEMALGGSSGQTWSLYAAECSLWPWGGGVGSPGTVYTARRLVCQKSGGVQTSA